MEENSKYHIIAKRLCMRCSKPLDSTEHGNKKSHPNCASKYKKQHQKEKYKVGNSAKLMIQKNEAVAAHLYKLDQQKNGIPFTVAMELGFKFDCPSTLRNHLNMKIHMLDKYGYTLETINGEILIFIYYESELL